MIRAHVILRPVLPAIAAATLVASGASAMPIQGGGAEVASHDATTRHQQLVPTSIDAIAHAATIRGIAVALADRACA